MPEKYVYMVIAIGKSNGEKVVFKLYGDVPKTADNFERLCIGNDTDSTGRRLTYKNSIFHRIIPNFMCQGGDFTEGNGTGGISVYGPKFADENFIHKHRPFSLSMANAGPNTNGSQFFITLTKTDWLDGKHVVFGEVVSGQEVVKNMEKVGSDKGKTSQPVTIVDCGKCDASGNPIAA